MIFLFWFSVRNLTSTSFCNRRNFSSLTHWFAIEIFFFHWRSFPCCQVLNLTLCFGIDNGLKLYIFQSFSRCFFRINWKKTSFQKVSNGRLWFFLFFFFQFLKSKHNFLWAFYNISQRFYKISSCEMAIY